ncbi:MAG: hypothetical protein QGH25_07625, partial [Candidatus Latescibacteria bacterium]|nr:hypothetical protein [Candidatus Latescibacterota bacterium]
MPVLSRGGWAIDVSGGQFKEAFQSRIKAVQIQRSRIEVNCSIICVNALALIPYALNAFAGLFQLGLVGVVARLLR